MRRLLLGLLALTLAGCSAEATQNMGQFVPPTAAHLGPACDVATPTATDTAVCNLYKANIVMCGVNVAAVGGMVNGALVIVPGYGAAAAAANGLIVAPVISAAQLYFCNMNGYLQPATPTAAK